MRDCGNLSLFWEAVESGDITGLSETLVHPFERAGLGKAPFTFLGAESRRGTCQYCGRPLATIYHVRSSDGNRFHVGCDCVEKTADTSLTSEVIEARRIIRRDRKVATRGAARDEAAELLKRHTKDLRRHPHPKIDGLTLADYISWRIEHFCNPFETIRLIQTAVGVAR